MNRLIIAGLFLINYSLSQEPGFLPDQDFMTDTLVIKLRPDSIPFQPDSSLNIIDQRSRPGSFLAIRQVMKSKTLETVDSSVTGKLKFIFLKQLFGYIPIDQVIRLEHPLAEESQQILSGDSLLTTATLSVDYLDWWYDNSPLFHKGWVLNGYTHLIDSEGKPKAGWQWETRVKKKKQESFARWTSRAVNTWLQQQSRALKADFKPVYKSLPYKRQLIGRFDYGLNLHGYFLDWRFSVDYPRNQEKRYVRGISGFGFMYQNYGSYQSVSVGSFGEQWFQRLRPSLLGRLKYGFYLGMNSFSPDKYDFMDLKNILLVKVDFALGLEYRPAYHHGLFGGVGIHQSVNLWPSIINRFETSLLISVGIIIL